MRLIQLIAAVFAARPRLGRAQRSPMMPHAPTAIRAVMHGMFDKPDIELVIDPIAIDDGFAVAGWTQGEMGGRAFLKAADEPLDAGPLHRRRDQVDRGAHREWSPRRKLPNGSLPRSWAARPTSIPRGWRCSRASAGSSAWTSSRPERGLTMLLRLVAAWYSRLLGCVAASAHATLVRSEPVTARSSTEAPRRHAHLQRTGSPLVLRLIAADGTATPLDGFRARRPDPERSSLPPTLDHGAYVAQLAVVSNRRPSDRRLGGVLGRDGRPVQRPDRNDADRPLEAAIVTFGCWSMRGSSSASAVCSSPPFLPRRLKPAIQAIVVPRRHAGRAVRLGRPAGPRRLGLTLADIAAPPWRGPDSDHLWDGGADRRACRAAALVGLGTQRPARRRSPR